MTMKVSNKVLALALLGMSAVNVEAMNNLPNNFMDKESAVAFLFENVDNPKVQCALALGLGLIVGKHEVAFEWFSRAAAQNYAPAQHNVGIMYTKGQGVALDLTKAFEWFSKAAIQNYAPSQFNLGAAYAEGLGVEPDQEKAFECFFKAAIQNHALAQFNLGIMYANGRGVERNLEKTREWYSRAAIQGFQPAIDELNKLLGK